MQTTTIAIALAYCALIAAACATATEALVIQEIYADPIGSETGGEAVLLYNDAGTSVDIGGFVLATPSNAQDAAVPAGTILAPHAAYLIADAGWSTTKDNASWADAHLEDAITLRNTGGTLSLLDSTGATVDSIGYVETDEGIALWRQGDTLVPTEPLFSPPFDALALLTTTGNASTSMTIRILDNGTAISSLTPTPGTTKHLMVEITSGREPLLTFLGTSWPVEPLGNGKYTAVIGVNSTLTPGQYNVSAIAENTASAPLRILPLLALESDARALALGAGTNRTLGVEGDAVFGTAKPTIRNAGNVPIEVRLSRTTLLRNTTRTTATVTATADKDAITVTSTAALLTTLPPGGSAPLSIVIQLPDGAQQGDYRTSFAFQLKEHK